MSLVIMDKIFNTSLLHLADAKNMILRKM